jgi:hypothetical protein
VQEFHFRITSYGGEVSASKMHRLHQVKLFPAICHITHGSKVIVQDENRLVATRMS